MFFKINHTILELAIQSAIYDRRNSWYYSVCKNDALSDFDALYRTLANLDRWSELIENGIAKRKLMIAPNGKKYQMTILPMEVYCIRYYLVYEMSNFAKFAWNSRCGKKRLDTTGTNSLFVGNLSRNKSYFKSWARERREKFALRVDIKNFYGSISHGVLLKIMYEYNKKYIELQYQEHWNNLVNLLQKLLPVRFFDKKIKVIERGLPIGNTTERYFSNFYLSSVDDLLISDPSVVSSRSIDDIWIYSDDKEVFCHIKEKIEVNLRALELRLNPVGNIIVRNRS